MLNSATVSFNTFDIWVLESPVTWKYPLMISINIAKNMSPFLMTICGKTHGEAHVLLPFVSWPVDWRLVRMGVWSVRRGGPKMRRWRWDLGFWLSSSLLCVALVSYLWVNAMFAVHGCGLQCTLELATIKCGPVIPRELWLIHWRKKKKMVRVITYSQCSTFGMLLS